MQIEFILKLATFKIFIEPKAKLNLKRVTYHEKLIRWNRWEGITRLFQMDLSTLAPAGLVFTDNKKITMEWRWWRQERLSPGYIIHTGADKLYIHADTGRQNNIQTCCSDFCLSASSCSEKSLAWFSLSDLERIRSSSTFSICTQEKKKFTILWLTENNLTVKWVCYKMSKTFILGLQSGTHNHT